LFDSLKIVYSNFEYSLLSIVIFTVLLIGLLLLSEFIFFFPFVTGHIPSGTEFGLSLIFIISILSAIVLPMNLYRIRLLKNSKKKIGGSIFGSFVGTIAGACSCGPIGFAVISTFGSVGATSMSFLTSYEIPIRIVAIMLLVVTLYTTSRSLKTECQINN